MPDGPDKIAGQSEVTIPDEALRAAQQAVTAVAAALGVELDDR